MAHCLQSHFTRLSSCDSPNPQDVCWKRDCHGCPFRRSTLTMLRRMFLGMAVLLVTACVGYDPYVTKFPQIALGDNRARVIDLMGQQPDSVYSVEVPLLKAEQLAWRTPGKGRIYLVLVVMDRTAAKFSVD